MNVDFFWPWKSFQLTHKPDTKEIKEIHLETIP